MKKCSKCRDSGHDKRTCKRQLRRKNPLNYDDIISVSLKQAPTLRNSPSMLRPKCTTCGDITAAIIIKTKNRSSQPYEWADRCLRCILDTLADRNIEYSNNPRRALGMRISDEQKYRKRKPSKRHSYSGVQTTCKICKAPAKDKDYCIDHLYELPYISKLKNELEMMEAEEDLIKEKGSIAINPNSPIIQNIIIQLELHGKQTITQLIKDIGVPSKIVRLYIDYLVGLGEVIVEKNKRGAKIISLT